MDPAGPTRPEGGVPHIPSLDTGQRSDPLDAAQQRNGRFTGTAIAGVTYGLANPSKQSL